MGRPRLLFSAAVAVAIATLGAPRPAWPQAPRPAQPKLTRPPKIAHFVEAPYPEAEKAKRRSASVVLRLTINVSGGVDEALVVTSAGEAFDAAAVAAARRFLFEPAEVDGKPSAVRILYEYTFTLREAPKKALFRGAVRDRKSASGIAGVTVSLDTGQQATTDAQGRFAIDEVEPGKHPITLSAPGRTPLRTEETFEAGKKLDATYDLEATPAAADDSAGDDLEVVVTAPPLQKRVVSTEVSAEEARRVPGTQGDVLKVVESMPGVARSTAGSGALIVWGAAPNDTRIYVDGVRVPILYHTGGLRSVVNSDMVQSVDLAPGGYDAAYGRGLGGLVTVQLKPLDAERLRGSVAVDLLDTAVYVEAPLSEHLHVAVAGRQGYLSSVLPLFTSRDVGELFPIPSYRDAQARVSYDLAPGTTVEVGGMFATDKVTRTVASADPTEQTSDANNVAFTRVYARLRKAQDDGGSVELVAYAGHDGSTQTSSYGATQVSLDVQSTVLGLRAAWKTPVTPYLWVTAGVDGEAVLSSVHRTGAPTLPPREGDIYVFGEPPPDTLATDSWTTAIGSLAPYAEADFSLLGGDLHMVPGVRFEPFVISGSRRTPSDGDTPAVGFLNEDTAIEPRVAARWQITPRLLARAAFGVYHEPPAPEDLSAVFGNPSLTTSSSAHWVAGLTARLAERLSIETTGFLTTSSGLAVRSQLDTPLLAEALVPDGRGRVYGAQALLRLQRLGPAFGWVSYSLLRSERADAPGGGYRLSDYDQTHVLTALGALDLGRGFDLGLRVRFATGFPRTPVIGAYFDAREDLYQPIFGAHNSVRIPNFFQADARVAKKFTFSGSALELYLDVQNVTNRQNPEEIVYNRNYTVRSYITGLPLLPVLGARFTW